MPRITRPQVYRVVREMLPREQFGPEELLRWLEGVHVVILGVCPIFNDGNAYRR